MDVRQSAEIIALETICNGLRTLYVKACGDVAEMQAAVAGAIERATAAEKERDALKTEKPGPEE